MYGVVSGDVQSTTEHNLSLIKLETGLDPTKATSCAVKKQLVRKTPAVPERQGEVGLLGQDVGDRRGLICWEEDRAFEHTDRQPVL